MHQELGGIKMTFDKEIVLCSRIKQRERTGKRADVYVQLKAIPFTKTGMV